MPRAERPGTAEACATVLRECSEGRRTVRVRGTAPQAWLLCGWLRSRLGREGIALEHEPAQRLEGVALDGEQVPLPPGEPPAPSDVLSDELERFTPDPVYEAAVLASGTNSS